MFVSFTLITLSIINCSSLYYHSMSSTITFEFDHQYAGDLASLGIEYMSCKNDYEVEVIEPIEHELTAYLKQHSDYYHVIK